MKRLVVIALAAGVAGLLTILAMPSVRESIPVQAQQPPQRTPRASARPVRTVEPSLPLPALTAQDESRARAMVTPAAMVARPGTPPTQLAELLGGQPFTIDAVHVWNTLPQTSATGKVEKLGAAVHLTLATPLAGTFTWPVTKYDRYDGHGQAIGEYREGVWTITASSITDVDVVVDFVKNRIVEIRPGPTAIIQQ